MTCDWGMVVAIVGTNIGLAAIIVGFMLWAFSKLDSDIKSLSADMKNDVKAQTERTDKLAQRSDQLAQRSDQLYQMFIDLLKEQRNPKTHP